MSSDPDEKAKARKSLDEFEKRLDERRPPVRVSQPDKWADPPGRPLDSQEQEADPAKKA